MLSALLSFLLTEQLLPLELYDASEIDAQLTLTSKYCQFTDCITRIHLNVSIITMDTVKYNLHTLKLRSIIKHFRLFKKMTHTLYINLN